MAEYETVTSFPVVDQARLAARNYGRSFLEALSTAYEATTACLGDTLSHCLPQLRHSFRHETSYDWEDDNNGRWSDELDRLLDTEGQAGEDSTSALSVILSRLPFVRGGSNLPYKPSAANLRRARNKSRTSIHSNGTGGTGESLRSRADLFDHSGDEFEDAGMLPDERIFALTAGNEEDSHHIFSEGQSEVELQEENRLAEQREEAILQIKRERAQRLAVKRGLSETLIPGERPRSAGQGSLRDAIPLRRGRSSTLQSQVSDVVPLRGRSSTLGSQSSGLTSPKVELPTLTLSQSNAANQSPVTPTSARSRSSLHSLAEGNTLTAQTRNTGEESEFSDFIAAEEPPADLETAPPSAAIQLGITQPAQPLPLSPSTSPTQQSSQESNPNHKTTTNDLPVLQSEDGQTTSPKTVGAEPVTPTISTSQPINVPSRSTVSNKPVILRSPSKVPGDYDPVTGYYRHKSDSLDVGVTGEGGNGEPPEEDSEEN